MKSKNACGSRERERERESRTLINTILLLNKLSKLFVSKIASVLVEQKNIENINDIEDRLFLNKKIACLFCRL